MKKINIVTLMITFRIKRAAKLETCFSMLYHLSYSIYNVCYVVLCPDCQNLRFV